MGRALNAGSAHLHRRPEGPPLIGFLSPLVDWWHERHLELMAAAGFDDVRQAHNAVFVHLPGEGRRLTGLADAAGMSKQAMAELVDDLVAKDYLAKVADPTDGRAKLIVWADRGLAAHEATMAAFGRIEAEVAEILGADELTRLRDGLATLLRATHG